MSDIKHMIKKIPYLMNFYRKIKFYKEFKYDFNFFVKNYMYAQETLSAIGYKILLLTHSLEKGMACQNKRYFGIEKTSELINELLKYEKMCNDCCNDFSYIVGINVLREYLSIYEANKWTNRDEYLKVKKFIEDHSKVKKINLNCCELNKKEIIKFAKIDYDKFLQSRHSIRSFSDKSLIENDIVKAVDMALKTPSACNRQMCKIYRVKNKKKLDYVIQNAQGFGGFDTKNANVFIVTFEVSANYFVGERNQGWFNAGLFSMNFVNALHSLGIGSCFIQFGNSVKEEEMIKEELKIPQNERIAVLLAAGYYNDKNIITKSPRKNFEDLYSVID